MSLLIAKGMVICGAALLCLALMPIHRLISRLPVGNLTQRWHAFKFLILLSICGYVAYVGVQGKPSPGMVGWVVPAMLLCGAVFVWLVATLALQTAADIQQMAGLEGGPIIDALTGTYNRHHFDCCLTRELDRARRYWLPLSIIMLDIDLFKRVNAAYGRQAGDQVLAHLGRLIFHLVRNTDVVARYEGDVFVVITPHTRLPDAQELAERLRLKVETTPVALPDAQAGSLNISVSIGVAALFDDVTDAEGLLRLAGDALYMAKKCGRDQVVVCDRSMVHAQLN